MARFDKSHHFSRPVAAPLNYYKPVAASAAGPDDNHYPTLGWEDSGLENTKQGPQEALEERARILPREHNILQPINPGPEVANRYLTS